MSFFGLLLPPEGWADPGGTAIPGQPVARMEQAPIPWPKFKNQINIQAIRWIAFQILSWKEQILHMILAKRPRSDKERWNMVEYTCISLIRPFGGYNIVPCRHLKLCFDRYLENGKSYWKINSTLKSGQIMFPPNEIIKHCLHYILITIIYDLYYKKSQRNTRLRGIRKRFMHIH